MGDFKNVLKSLRTSQNLTQDELSKRLKISRSTIGMYEKGAREPDFETLELIADFFNVDTDYLLGRTSKTTYIPFNPTDLNIIHCETKDECNLIHSYRKLNTENQKKCASYTQTLLTAQEMETELMAAHSRTDIDHTPEGQKHDLDIMGDDSKW